LTTLFIDGLLCVWHFHIGACILAFTHNILFGMLFTKITFRKFNIFPFALLAKYQKAFSKSQLGIHMTINQRDWMFLVNQSSLKV
jgi:hypothetical protein